MANIYLDPLDHLLTGQGVERVRYADDFVLMCRSEEQAKAALARVQTWVEQNGLTLHPEKTHIVDATQPGGFDFLGYHFERGYKWPRRKALDRFKDKVRKLTPRKSGESMEATVTKLNDMLRGMDTSNTVTAPRFRGWTDMSEDDSARSCANARAGEDEAEERTTKDGATTTSTSWACIACKPRPRPVGLLDE